jgi:hypothetical protein
MRKDLIPQDSAQQLRELMESPAVRAIRKANASDIGRLREFTESPAMRAIQALNATDVSRLVQAASEVHRNVQNVLQSPSWTRMIEQIESIRFTPNPEFISAISRLHEGISQLAVTIPPAVLPTAEALTRLAEQTAYAIRPFQSSLASLSSWQEILAQRMRMLNHAWAVEGEIGVSAIGFARLARISDAANSEEPYAGLVGELLSEELGEHVERDDANSPGARDVAAIEAGMRPELIAFPPHEYGRVVFAAGFRFKFAGAPVPQAMEGADPGAAFHPMHGFVLTEVEQRLRQMVEARLSDLEKTAWVKRRVPGAVRQRWTERQEEDRAAGRPVYPPVHYADFMDLADVICQGKNWSEAFESIFLNTEDFRVSMRRLHPIRKALAHSRPLGRADVLTLMSEATRILSALRVPVL